MEEKYTYDSISRKLKNALESTSSGKKFLAGKKKFNYFVMGFMGWEYKLGFIFSIISWITILPLPILIKYFIEWLENPGASDKEGYIVAGLIGVSYIISSVFRFIEVDGGYYGRVYGKATCQVISFNLTRRFLQ